MTSVVHYSFRNDKETAVVRFEGEDISAPGLKAKIAEQRGLTTRLYSDFDLTLTNAGTSKEYASNERIPRNSVVVVCRKKLFKPTRPVQSRHLEGARPGAGIPTRPATHQFERRVGSSSDDSSADEFDGTVRRELRCAMSEKLMIDPVQLPCCKFSVSRCRVASVLLQTSVCPLCFQSGIQAEMLIPMPAVRSRVVAVVSSARRQGLELHTADLCQCDTCSRVQRCVDVRMSSETPEQDASLERKRKRVEEEDMYVGFKGARQADAWHFRGTTEYKRRAAERFLSLYSAAL